MENINGWSKAPGTYQRKCNEEKSVNTILAAGYREIKIIKHHSYLSGSERSLRHEDVKIFFFILSWLCVCAPGSDPLGRTPLEPVRPQQKEPRFISDENDGFPKPTSLSVTNQEDDQKTRREKQPVPNFFCLIINIQSFISGKDSGNFLIRTFSKRKIFLSPILKMDWHLE